MDNRVEIIISLEEQDIEKLRELAGDSDWSEYLTAAIKKLYIEQYILGESATLDRLIDAVQAMNEERKKHQHAIHVLREELKALQINQQQFKDDIHTTRTLLQQFRSDLKPQHLH